MKEYQEYQAMPLDHRIAEKAMTTLIISILGAIEAWNFAIDGTIDVPKEEAAISLVEAVGVDSNRINLLEKELKLKDAPRRISGCFEINYQLLRLIKAGGLHLCQVAKYGSDEWIQFTRAIKTALCSLDTCLSDTTTEYDRDVAIERAYSDIASLVKPSRLWEKPGELTGDSSST